MSFFIRRTRVAGFMGVRPGHLAFVEIEVDGTFGRLAAAG